MQSMIFFFVLKRGMVVTLIYRPEVSLERQANPILPQFEFAEIIAYWCPYDVAGV